MKLISNFRLVKNSTSRAFDIPDIRLLTRLCLQFSDLNELRFRHAIDCRTPFCICGFANEENEHSLVHCPKCHSICLHLFGQSLDIPETSLASIDDTSLCNLFLYRNTHFNVIENSVIIDVTISYIKNMGSFDWG